MIELSPWGHGFVLGMLGGIVLGVVFFIGAALVGEVLFREEDDE